MSKGDAYKLLASVILPRPIAWVVSRSAAGELNAAPYSFFNILSSDPPLVAISFSAAPDREGKDSLTFIRERGEFVVNMVPEELAEAMNTTATNAPRGTDETQLAGLELAPSQVVDVPRIAGSPVALECRVFEMLEPGGSSTILLGRIVYVHVRTSAFEDAARLHIDPGADAADWTHAWGRGGIARRGMCSRWSGRAGRFRSATTRKPRFKARLPCLPRRLS